MGCYRLQTRWVDLKPVKPNIHTRILSKLEIHPTRILPKLEYTRFVFNLSPRTDRSKYDAYVLDLHENLGFGPIFNVNDLTLHHGTSKSLCLSLNASIGTQILKLPRIPQLKIDIVALLDDDFVSSSHVGYIITSGNGQTTHNLIPIGGVL